MKARAQKLKLRYSIPICITEFTNKTSIALAILLKKGDPCVIINGTIRNDYDEDYFFCIDANVYNSKGKKWSPSSR